MRNTTITIGSIVYGDANIGCKVLEINGDTLTIETVNGECLIPFSRVVRVDPPPLLDQLEIISTLDKAEAIDGVNALLLEFSPEDVYQASLKLGAFPGAFVRGLLL
jgi:hypothetical protein